MQKNNVCVRRVKDARFYHLHNSCDELVIAFLKQFATYNGVVFDVCVL